MMNHLKYTLISLSAGLLFISCSGDEAVTSGCEMKFDVSSVSRAAVTTASAITERPFAIFGDMIPSEAGDNPSIRTVVYNNTPVTYNNSAWTTPVTQYWFNNHEHSFVALHPASVLSSEADIQYSNSQLSFTYTLPSDPSQVHDLLTATHRRRYIDQRTYDEDGNMTGTAAEVVYLQFNHLMAQINLAAKFQDNILGSDSYLEFKKIKLSGYKDKGTFKVKPSPLLTNSQTDDREIAVTDQTGNRELTIEFPAPVKVYNNGQSVALFDYSDAIIMLPQIIETGAETHILLTYTQNGEEEEKVIRLALSGNKWETGKSYNYRFTIDHTGPHFESPSISNWDELDGGGLDVH